MLILFVLASTLSYVSQAQWNNFSHLYVVLFSHDVLREKPSLSERGRVVELHKEGLGCGKTPNKFTSTEQFNNPTTFKKR